MNPSNLYRPVYNALINMVGQYLTNEWAVKAALGVPVRHDRLVLALTCEKTEDGSREAHLRNVMLLESTLLGFPGTMPAGAMTTTDNAYRVLLYLADEYRRDYAQDPQHPLRFGVMDVFVPLNELPEWLWPPQHRITPTIQPVTQPAYQPAHRSRPVHVRRPRSNHGRK